ncbi:VPDSG-CTERM sorting domain-containing protein [Pedosphaera parvula]|uniref:2-deoxy-D-gluconate-3-dehydrogenase n=1 Tax=Pedosphaera parvula (strain Ellin514) TaxID=320771 RepID=B9XD47_PEDPL|nr:VPDSG-CTERM sorting domain-containing protein [Pedosphaera parvula]EEF62393.1 2-deoxy-D-gluconate-3-dehydrogenase [Pedosphaera parvula Ellin514]
MMKWIKISVAAVMLALGTWSVSATPINGTITFAGGVTLNNADAGAATAVTGWVAPFVQSSGGDFGSIAVNTPVSIHAPWSFNSGPVASFWSVGGFTFDLISSSIAATVPGVGVVVTGTGTISGNSFTPTVGTWSFSTQNPSANAIFSFSASTGAVPDSGTTLVLLGCALSGVGLLRKKLMA